MKICPRCDRPSLFDDDVMNSLSHIDNKTFICSKCGEASGLVAQGAQSDMVEFAMEERFKKRLGY